MITLSIVHHHLSRVMLRLAVLFCVLSMPLLAFAQDGGDAREQLSDTMDAIKQSTEREKQIEAQHAKLEKELSDLQEETVSLARESSGQEETLAADEERLAILEEQKKTRDVAFEQRKEELSSLISAMVKLKSFPPEAVIAMPGKLDETLAAARALSVVTQAIEEDAESLKGQLDELDELTRKIEKNRQAVLAHKTELEARHANLNAKIQERSRLQSELGARSEKEKEELAHLQEKSHSLQDLVDALGREETPKQAEHEVKTTTAVARHHGAHEMRSFASAKGRLHMPVSGKVVRRYNDGGDETAFSRGITIATPEDANVVAPFDGQVVYAGSFRDYGEIVIIRHSDDYHTLLSGMEHINCTPGQYLLEGEPVGSMGEDHDARRLYLEVRKGGKPVDPLPWLHAS